MQAILHSCRVPVVRTHDPRCHLDHYESTGLIIIKRQDIFAAAMSNCIVWATGQDIDYPKKHIDPIEISEKAFINQLAVQIHYRHDHDFNRPYHSIYDFNFEDFVQNHGIVLDRLGLKQDPILINLPQLNNPAPYNYQQVIKNHVEIRKIFNTLDLNSLKNPFANNYGKEFANYN